MIAAALAVPMVVATVAAPMMADAESGVPAGAEVLYSAVGQNAVRGTSADEVAMYRAYNPNTGEHHYTASWVEYTSIVTAGWNPEGYAWVSPARSNTPVYRLYNPYVGDHHYTTSKVERDYLISVGWNSEGIGWYSSGKNTVPVRRAYNPNAVTATHHYSTSPAEIASIVQQGWKDEGIGWYAVKDGSDPSLPPAPKPDGPWNDGWLICENENSTGYVKYSGAKGWRKNWAEEHASNNGYTNCKAYGAWS